MKADWKTLAKDAYDAWARNGDVHAQMHAIRCALAEAPACDAEHKSRPDATCSLPKGHGGYHAWTRSEGCAHPKTRGTSPPACTACGLYIWPAAAPSEGKA